MFHEGMTMIKLRRPMLLGEPDTFMEEVSHALDLMGIVPGDEFVIGRPADLKRATPGAARRTDPVTAKEAAASVKANKREQIVYDALVHAGVRGMTGDEVWEKCDPQKRLGRDSWVPRLGGLANKGLARATEETRMGRHGRKQQVYVALVQGRPVGAPTPQPKPEPQPASSLF